MPVSVIDARLEALHMIDMHLLDGKFEFPINPLLSGPFGLRQVREIYEPLGWDISFKDDIVKFRPSNREIISADTLTDAS